ncbi:MAG: hypothetical protein DRI90_17725 [Deltaproteobacteria bacterium]|nr:MAG: hypothetical protein DRI90_17725 [Deltaproteobacteria bacterium]
MHRNIALAALPLSVLFLLLSFAGCSASGTAKVNVAGEGAEGSVQTGQQRPPAGEGVWEDDNADPAVGAAAEAPALGRSVEAQGHGEVPMATLPGFRMFRDGTSRVFVEVSAEVPVKETRAEGVLTYRFVGVKVPERVNLMELPTQYFPTPVSRVRLVKVEDDAELIIELRAATKPKTRLRKDAGGTVLSVDFPRLSESSLDDSDTRSNAKP